MSIAPADGQSRGAWPGGSFTGSTGPTPYQSGSAPPGHHRLVVHTGPMANQAKLTIFVTWGRGSSTVRYSTNGRYVSLTTNNLQNRLLGQPIQPTSSQQAFWASVLDIVEQDIAGHT